jgi:cold shock CspA family protein
MAERQWDETLMHHGVITHYLPLANTVGARLEEKGIDVWFALEAYELALHKRFDVVVLIACDSDYVPLVRKLNTLGTRVMLLGWDFEYKDESGTLRTTRTSQRLVDEVTYPLMMNLVIDDKSRKNDSVINDLFIPKQTASVKSPTPVTNGAGQSVARKTEAGASNRATGAILRMKERYGFIKSPVSHKHIFFHPSALRRLAFTDLREGMVVDFNVSQGEKGPIAADIDVKS